MYTEGKVPPPLCSLYEYARYEPEVHAEFLRNAYDCFQDQGQFAFWNPDMATFARFVKNGFAVKRRRRLPRHSQYTLFSRKEK